MPCPAFSKGEDDVGCFRDKLQHTLLQSKRLEQTHPTEGVGVFP